MLVDIILIYHYFYYYFIIQNSQNVYINRMDNLFLVLKNFFSACDERIKKYFPYSTYPVIQ